MEKSEGLGDDIHRIATATGIDKVVKKVFTIIGSDCGCDGRREKLNKYPSVLNPRRPYTRKN